MKNIDDILDYFDQYLNNQLSDKEKSEFENRLKTDEKFKLDFEAHKAIIKAFRNIGRAELKNELNVFHEQVFEEEFTGAEVSANLKHSSLATAEKTSYKFYYLIAASIIILIGLSVIILNYTSNSHQANKIAKRNQNFHFNSLDSGSHLLIYDTANYNNLVAEKDFKIEVNNIYKKEIGVAGNVTKEFVIIIHIKIKNDSNLYYKFMNDTLKLYSQYEIKKEKLSLDYDSKQDVYYLKNYNTKYKIEKGINKIIELK